MTFAGTGGTLESVPVSGLPESPPPVSPPPPVSVVLPSGVFAVTPLSSSPHATRIAPAAPHAITVEASPYRSHFLFRIKPSPSKKPKPLNHTAPLLGPWLRPGKRL